MNLKKSLHLFLKEEQKYLATLHAFPDVSNTKNSVFKMLVNILFIGSTHSLLQKRSISEANMKQIISNHIITKLA